jgi:hypothetical protein
MWRSVAGCGLAVLGLAIVRWGNDEHGQLAAPPTAFTTGWGDNLYGQLHAP